MFYAHKLKTTIPYIYSAQYAWFKHHHAHSWPGRKTWHPWPVNPLNECLFSPCAGPLLIHCLSAFHACQTVAMTVPSRRSVPQQRGQALQKADGEVHSLNLLVYYPIPGQLKIVPVWYGTHPELYGPTRNIQTTAHRINTCNFPRHWIPLPGIPAFDLFYALTKNEWKHPFSHFHKWQGSLYLPQRR